MLSVTLRLLSLVALGVAQKQTVSVWMPPNDPQLFLPADAKDVAASIVGSVREHRVCLNDTELTHDYVGRQFNNICTRLPFPKAEGTRLGR